MRDAVASPAAFAAAPFLARPGVPSMPPPQRQAFPAGAEGRSAIALPAPIPPTSLVRLSIEFASGLVVKVRAALGLPSASVMLPAGIRRVSVAPGSAPRVGAVTAVPLTSTEWLERRGTEGREKMTR